MWETRTEMCKDSTSWCIVDGHCKKHLCMSRGKPFSKYFPMTATYHHSAARACRVAASICFVLVFLAAVVSPVPAQTTRTWTNSTNTQFNNTANWNPTNAWADNDTLRFKRWAAACVAFFSLKRRRGLIEDQCQQPAVNARAKA